MRPERSHRSNSNSARRGHCLAAVLLALLILPWPGAQAGNPAPQSSAGPAYDAATFVQELHRNQAELQSAGKSTEGLRSYRESLPKTWSVDAGDHHYDVPTQPLVSRLAVAESRPELRLEQIRQARDYL